MTLKEIYDELPLAVETDKKNMRIASAHIDTMIEASKNEEEINQLSRLQNDLSLRFIKVDENCDRIQKSIQQLAMNMRSDWVDVETINPHYGLTDTQFLKPPYKTAKIGGQYYDPTKGSTTNENSF
jgi:hypothetical protein